MDYKFEDNIIKTLSYFDIFDYPLTLQEIKKYNEQLILISDEDLISIIEEIPTIQESNGYYYFLGRREIVDKRIERNDISVNKFAKAKVIGKILSKIPTIDYIGVSGSLSMNNAITSDDIDLFFITQKNTLWFSRFFVNMILLILGQKRKRKGQFHKDKICPNMYMDKKKLTFSIKNRNIYIAHEISQLKTIYDKSDTYNLFLMRNKWINAYLPNIQIPTYSKKRKLSFEKVMQKFILLFESGFYFLQKLYMVPHKSIEKVMRHRAMFHPINKESIIIDMYKLKSDQYLKQYYDNVWLDREEARFYFDEKKIRILN